MDNSPKPTSSEEHADRWKWIQFIAVFGFRDPRCGLLTDEERKSGQHPLGGVWYRLRIISHAHTPGKRSVLVYKWKTEYGTSLCKSHCCHCRGESFSCFHRDANACSNIFKAFLWDLILRRRPKHLTRRTASASATPSGQSKRSRSGKQ